MENNREESEFNDVVNKLRRMDNYFENCSIARYDKNSDLWLQSLASLFSELITAMKNDEPNEIENLNIMADKVNKFYADALNKGQAPMSLGVPRELYWELFKFEMFLRKVYKAAGYEGKKKDDAGGALR